MKHIQDFESFLNEENLNEADMTKFYDGFKLLNGQNNKSYQFKYKKGVKNTKVEADAETVLMQRFGLPRNRFMVHAFIKKGQWTGNEGDEVSI